MRGEIRDVAKYKQAKLLNHSGWAGKLKRKITPSDVDMVIESRKGHFLLVELKDKETDWTQLDKGQLMMYQQFARNDWKQIPVLACHEPVEPEQQIDTLQDITTFSLMIKTQWGEKIEYWTRRFDGNDQWQKFVIRFVNGDLQLNEVRAMVSKEAQRI